MSADIRAVYEKILKDGVGFLGRVDKLALDAVHFVVEEFERRVLAFDVEQQLLEEELLAIPEGTSVLPEDSRQYSRSVESLPDQQQRFLLPRTLLTALQRFATTGSIQAVSDTIKEHCEVESDRTKNSSASGVIPGKLITAQQIANLHLNQL